MSDVWRPALIGGHRAAIMGGSAGRGGLRWPEQRMAPWGALEGIPMYELFAWARPSVATARRAFGRLPRIATSAGRWSQEVREFCEAVGPLVASAGGSLEVAPGHAWVILPLAAVEEVGPLVEAAARRSKVHLFDPRTDWLLRPDGTSDGSPDWGFAATVTGERRFGPGRPPLRRPGSG